MMPTRARLICSAVLTGALASQPVSAGEFFGDGPVNLQVGGIVMVMPKYEGAKDYEAIGVPFIAPAGLGDDGRVQFRGPEDLRFRLFESHGFEAGPLAGWRFDRDESDSSHLDGLGDVEGGLVAGGYVAYRAGPFLPFVSYHHQVTGDDTGAMLRFGAEAKAPIWDGFTLTATAGATWADDDYMDSYFSKTAAQGGPLPIYDADAGVKDVFIGVSGDMPLTADWTLKLSGRYVRLLADAADSPIVEQENQFYGGLGLTYRFSFDR